MSAFRGLVRRLVPRSVRNWVRSPSQSMRWIGDELQHFLGHDLEIGFRPGWTVRAHPASRRPFNILLRDPDQIAELDAFIALCRPRMVLFDLGAHFGLFSLAALHYGGPEARAVAVDASAVAIRMLRLHVRLNHVGDRLQMVRAAAAAQSGFQYMLAVGVIADGFYVPQDASRPARDLVRVRAVTVDGLVDEVGLRPTHLKIDVEGAEADVLRGAGRTLASRRPPAVFLEVHNEILRRAGRDPAECVSQLTQLGYTVTTPRGDLLGADEAMAPPVMRLIARRGEG